MKYTETESYLINDITIYKKDNDKFDFLLRLEKESDNSIMEFNFEDIGLKDFKWADEKDNFSKYYVDVPEKHQYSFIFMKEN
ncbi:hypothetical protein J2Z35_001180 [Acetoanaerobium pronyense]|uniref:Uncharacterized protein n=2 Tax=Acetoanaerobium pronyense TaxID=1482736 RepID=A0ABS4KHX5_9FIRM|nr:hypothetical protein [Acetoanaerobium pronyense]